MDSRHNVNWRRAWPTMTSFGIVVLAGAAGALYLCTPRGDTPGMAPGKAIVVGFGGAAGTFVMLLAVTLGVTLTGLSNARDQLRESGSVSTPTWMQATVKLRTAFVYLLYGWLGFALGGTVAATLGLLRQG